VAKPTVAAEVHQPLDIHRDVAAEIALDEIVSVDDLADLDNFGVGQIANTALGRNADLLDNLMRLGGANAMNIAEADFDPLLGWDIDAGNARHDASP
jgi:hypothetical protein